MEVSTKLGVLDFTKLENEMITGLSIEEINKIVDDQWLSRLENACDENDIFTTLEESTGIISDDNGENDDVTETLDSFEKKWRPQSSVIQEKSHVQKFRNFLIEHNKSDVIETMPVDELNNNLRHFYSKLLRMDGQPYSGSSLLCIPAAIHAYIGYNCTSEPEYQHHF